MSNSNVLQLPNFDFVDDAVIVESEPLELEIVESEDALEFPELPNESDDHWEVDPELGDMVPTDPLDTLELDTESDESLESEITNEAEILSEPEVDLAEEKLDAAERLLEELSGATNMLQLEVAARVEEIVQSMTAALFPKLAEDFLAEEINRFLSYAVPKDAVRIDVSVPAPLEESLTERVSRNKALQDYCLVHPLKSGAEPMVKANWGEGGFEYDLTSLLAACHARIPQNGNEVEE